jgi:predicted regulator of Ras-like GTPase activity (Roadblock/LC7/MglB family)
LNDIRQVVPGTRAVCLAAGDGISVEMVGGEDLDLEILAAEFVSMAKGISNVQRGLAVGETARLEIQTDQYAVLLRRLLGDYYLLLVVEAGKPLGRARFELHRAAAGFEEDLA